MAIDGRVLLNIILPLGLVLVFAGAPVRSATYRWFAVGLLATLTAWYAVWRVTETLPEPAWSPEILWPWLFFAFEAVALVYEAWCLYVLTGYSDRTPDADRYEAMLRRRDDLPTVDVYIATYNEPAPILDATILGALALDYPMNLLRVWVLDDSRRPWLKELCERRGAGYLARPSNEHGKAGNLNYAYPRTDGAFILCLDADFVVEERMLYRMLGFLVADPGVGLVQTPQHFRNPDPIQHNLFGGSAWTEESNYFMTVTQPCRDAHDNAFCVGTGFVVRRAALETLGGFAQGSLSEDLQLTYALLGHGYRTVFLNEELSLGLSPESVPEYVKQRVRWCQGTLQQAFLKTGPFLAPRLTLVQRMFYAETILYWLTFPFLVLLLLAPIIQWYTGVAALRATTADVILVILPRVFARSVILYWLSEGKVVPLVSTVGKVVPAFHLTGAMLKSLFNPFGSPFKVTTKGQSRDGVIIHWSMFGIFAGLAVVLAIGMLSNLLGFHEVVAVGELTPLDVLWSSGSLLILVLAAMVCVELPPAPEGEEVHFARLGATARAIFHRLFA